MVEDIITIQFLSYISKSYFVGEFDEDVFDENLIRNYDYEACHYATADAVYNRYILRSIVILIK